MPSDGKQGQYAPNPYQDDKADLNCGKSKNQRQCEMFTAFAATKYPPAHGNREGMPKKQPMAVQENGTSDRRQVRPAKQFIVNQPQFSPNPSRQWAKHQTHSHDPREASVESFAHIQ